MQKEIMKNNVFVFHASGAQFSAGIEQRKGFAPHEYDQDDA